LASRALIEADLCTPNLPFIFWASICIPVLPSPVNATNAMFDALDEFLSKTKETDQPIHYLAQYGTLVNLQSSVEDLEDLSTEVNNWPVCLHVQNLG